MDVLDAGCI